MFSQNIGYRVEFKTLPFEKLPSNKLQRSDRGKAQGLKFRCAWLMQASVSGDE